MDESDELTSTDDALLTCGGFHHGDPGRHIGHHHRRHHHHGGGGHLPTGNGGSTGMGGSTGGGGSTGTGGGGMVDPRCADVSGMVSWWHADNDYDDAVGSNDGTTGGDVAFVGGMTNQGFGLNGNPTSDVVVPHDASLMMTGAFTLDAWINSTDLGGRIIDKATAFGGDGFLMDLVSGWVRIFVSGDSLASVDQVPAGVFTHVAVTYDGTNFSVYINGGLQSTKATWVTAVTPNTLPMRFGQDSSGGSNFSGVIDEPRVFNRALSVTEVAQLYWQTANCH